MSDDIVTRLRKQGEFHQMLVRLSPTLPDEWDDSIVTEAADEIELLQQELNNAVAKANAYYELVEAYRWSHSYLGEWPDAISSLVAENHELRKAVRGEP